MEFTKQPLPFPSLASVLFALFTHAPVQTGNWKIIRVCGRQRGWRVDIDPFALRPRARGVINLHARTEWMRNLRPQNIRSMRFATFGLGVANFEFNTRKAQTGNGKNEKTTGRWNKKFSDFR